MFTTSLPIFSSPLFATYSVYARYASIYTWFVDYAYQVRSNDIEGVPKSAYLLIQFALRMRDVTWFVSSTWKWNLTPYLVFHIFYPICKLYGSGTPTPMQNNSFNWPSENGFGLQFGKIWSREKWSQRKALDHHRNTLHVSGALSENLGASPLQHGVYAACDTVRMFQAVNVLAFYNK